MNNLDNEHAALVERLFKPGKKIAEAMCFTDHETLHAAVGIAGESGEIIDAVKKAVIYRKPLNRENLVEELGDMEFYLQALRQRTGITREETLIANMAKLGVRYSEGSYSDQQAQERADKEGGEK